MTDNSRDDILKNELPPPPHNRQSYIEQPTSGTIPSHQQSSVNTSIRIRASLPSPTLVACRMDSVYFSTLPSTVKNIKGYPQARGDLVVEASCNVVER
eukprot:CCRYP_003337-RE/>CCRYP_003337-RE protein AED:0.47 eAED:1.00 QI:0/0/0/1/0/0/2/0/97